MSHARSEASDFKALAPDAYEVVLALGGSAGKAGLDKQLLELVKLRASQINGCAFCVQFHILQAERLGMAVDKLNLVVVWREAPQFSARERAALGMGRSADAADRRRQRRSLRAGERRVLRERTGLSLAAIASINVWNRLGVAIAGPRRRGRSLRLPAAIRGVSRSRDS